MGASPLALLLVRVPQPKVEPASGGQKSQMLSDARLAWLAALSLRRGAARTATSTPPPATVALPMLTPTQMPVPPTDTPILPTETTAPTPTETATPLPTATPATPDDLKLDVPIGNPAIM